MVMGVYKLEANKYTAIINTNQHTYSIEFTNGAEIIESRYPEDWAVTRVMQFILSFDNIV